jgi:hypothetical protein
MASFYEPLPFIARGDRNLYGRWLDDPGDGISPDRVGFDAEDRPVVVLSLPGSEYERAMHCWRYLHDGFEELERDGTVVRRAIASEGLVRWIVESDRTGSLSVSRLSWAANEAVRCDEAHAGRGRQALSAVSMLEIDRDGCHGRLWRGFTGNETPTSTSTPVAEVVDDLERALAIAATLPAENVLWDGRVSRPEPWPDHPEALVEPLALALDRALRETAARSGVAEPFCLTVHAGARTEGPAFPPTGRLAGVAFRERMRAASVHDGAAITQLHLGDAPDGVAVLELVDHLDNDALRACRVLSTAVDHRNWSPDHPADAVIAALAQRLSERLNHRPLTGATEPFAALVHDNDLYGDRDPLARYTVTVGADRAQTFLDSVRSAVLPIDQARADALAERALSDRGALEELLTIRGLADHARAIAHQVAAPGLLLHSAGGVGDAPTGSRLGGPALLPPDEPWPETATGTSLSFLAALDLHELGGGHVHAAMPDSGWLLFYAAIDDVEDAEPNRAGSPIRVFHLGDGVAPVAAATPRALDDIDGAVLRHHPVTARLFLTLPDGYDAPADLGLDAIQSETFEEIAEQLRCAMDADADDHWLGGLRTGVQGHPTEPGTVLLLHLSHDPALGFSWGDGGAFQFRIDQEALARRDWADILVYADCC